MLKHFEIILFLFFGFLFLDCAAIVKTSNQKVIISSNPQGAKVFIDSLEKGVTPLLIDLSRKENHKVQIELTGYEKYSTQISSSINLSSIGWLLPDLLVGLWIGAILDVEFRLTDGYLFLSGPIISPILDIGMGGLNKLTPESITVSLKKSGTASIDKQDKLLSQENK